MTVATYERVGVTASRHGLTAEQHRALAKNLRLLRNERGAQFFHHGDCVGGDYEGACLARGMGYRIIGHPPINDELRAFVESDENRKPAGYLTRDRALVDEVDLLLGCPNTTELPPGPTISGSWYTIKYARRVGTRVAVILPDGSWASER